MLLLRNLIVIYCPAVLAILQYRLPQKRIQIYRRPYPRGSFERKAVALPEVVGSHLGERHAIEVDIRGDGSCMIAFETGLIGKQASGAVVVRSGGTIVYNTACYESAEGDFDFIPLRVDYQERQSAGGRTKGGYQKRDGRPSEDEILVSRLIDRPLRPMIAEGWRHDTQLLSWVLSYDGETVPDPLSICGSAAALAVSDIPLVKPVAAVEVGMNPDTLEFIINPNRAEAAASPLHMTLAGTAEGVLMIEGAANFLTEAQMVEAVSTGHRAVTRICNALESWAADVGKKKKN